MLAGELALTVPLAGCTVYHLLPLMKNVAALKVMSESEGLFSKIVWAAGSDPPAVPTKIKPVGETVGSTIELAAERFKTTVTTRGELAAPGDETRIWP